MKDKIAQDKLDKIVLKLMSNKLVFGAVFYVSSIDKKIDFISVAGNMQADTPYYVASINKMMISAIMLRLINEGEVAFNDHLASYLSANELEGLSVIKGVEYSREITIYHLLSNTSGLPDYLADRQANGRIAIKDLEAGKDHAWDIQKVLKEVKKMRPHFTPGKPGKAKYIDTNHHLLGLVIERITGRQIQEVLHRLFHELGMNGTYVFGERETSFAPIFYKSSVINIPVFLSSTHQEIISTARDQMVFLKAFFNGHFYPKEKMKTLEQWNRIFFPFKYGVGLQLFSLPAILTGFRKLPDFIGHSGSTGTLAFYVPDKDLYITGAINQQAAPRLAFQAMVRIVEGPMTDNL